MLKKATLGISWEIWCSNQETVRFDEKLGDSWENRESWQVCASLGKGVVRAPCTSPKLFT